MKPALTAEEWRKALRGGDIGWNAEQDIVVESVRRLASNLRPAVAALALYGQTFGFTREDVTQLRFLAATDGWEAFREFAIGLADRIEALLPPEG